MSADLHVVPDDYALEWQECHRLCASVSAYMLLLEKPGATNYQTARKAEMKALDLSKSFGLLANIAWERDNND